MTRNADPRQEREPHRRTAFEDSAVFPLGSVGFVAGGLLDGCEALIDLVAGRSCNLHAYFAVAHEDERRPQLDTKGSAEWPAFAVFDLDVLNIGELQERGGEFGLHRLAIAAPMGTEFDQ